MLVALLFSSIRVAGLRETQVGQALMIGTIILGGFALINDVIDRYTDMQ